MTRVAWWLIPTAVVGLACPLPPPAVDAGPDVTPLSTDALCQRITVARCDANVRCFPAFTRRDRAACIEEETARCTNEASYALGAISLGEVTTDEAQLERCERRLATSTCPPSFPPGYVDPSVAQPFDDCTLTTGLLRGHRETGKECVFAYECAPGNFCVRPGGVCRGTCAALSLAGEPCGIGCHEGLRCDGDVCAPLKGRDEPCASSDECEAELICTGSCRPRRQLNESCVVDPARLSQCEPGLACDVVPYVSGLVGTCIAPRNEFQPCAFHWSCRAGLVCADLNWSTFPGSAPAPGQCRPPDGPGDNCPQSAWGAYVGDQCRPGLTCVEGANFCDVLPVRGQSCTPSKRNCAGFGVFCKPTGSGDVGVCAEPPVIGDRCAVRIAGARTVEIPCATGWCDTETTLQCRTAVRTTGSECRQDAECITGRCVPQSDMTLRCAPPC